MNRLRVFISLLLVISLTCYYWLFYENEPDDTPELSRRISDLTFEAARQRWAR